MYIRTARLTLRLFRLEDAPEVFACISPTITRFLRWDPPEWDIYLSRCEARVETNDPTERAFVVRRRDTNECLGMAAAECADQPTPELGLWLKESAHGQGYGLEVVSALVRWASEALEADGFLYPVAVHNLASRRIAERLSGRVVETRATPKYDAVVYRIPASLHPLDPGEG